MLEKVWFLKHLQHCFSFCSLMGFSCSDKIRAMDISDYTRIVFDKIQKIEPEHATKIIGYLLLQDNGEQEMAKLASCPDHFIREVAFKAKNDLQRLAATPAMLSISPTVNPPQGLSHLSVISPRTPTSPPSFQVPSPYWDPHSATNTNPDFMGINYLDSIAELQKQTQLFGLENHMDPVNTGTGGIVNDFYGLDASAANLSGKSGRRFSEFPFKVCHYFNKGFCKHGANCKFYHGQVPECLSQMYGNDAISEDQVVSPGSLAQLELEIIELLKSRSTPMSIASLPMAYYDKYKKVLQADGYLTESQRHGKSGYSLTKLLARLKNSIRLIDRPHGQHAVVLAEDAAAPTYLQRGEFARHISASRQIYLTFPAESTFTEDDVSDYFNTFGEVEDVRIPNQSKRMFGFVTFVDPETVKTILGKGNPHYVHGSRVLVKPYREKGKVNERKCTDRTELHICSPHYLDTDFEHNSILRSCGNHRSIRRQLIEEQDQALRIQRRQLAQLQFAQKPFTSSPRFGFSVDEPRVLDDHFNFQQAEESFSYLQDDKPRLLDTNFSDENSNQALNLPDSPFAFPI
ncbi:zinc finger CCCH domain-containing protein 18-like isoform X1 [Abrus precatorius]|uniref:Zinc finger CCCH domain-containing protein 18-like isoform X1 n=1 Tax=Abrus precatorius TaxID=3816 RepID=A0A8B8JFU9_ABRPR|nr:zinc finger CCCH domain-containing protein 18-like isoform X1 [Abrus precatorius]